MLRRSVFIDVEIRTDCHKIFALRLALKERRRGTREWLIQPMDRVRFKPVANACKSRNGLTTGLYCVLFRLIETGLFRIRSPKQGRRTTVKRETSKSTKSTKTGGEMSPSERLRENIRKYRTKARLLEVDPTSLEDDSDESNGLENSSVLQSPIAEKDVEMKMAEMSSGERWLKLKAEVSDDDDGNYSSLLVLLLLLLSLLLVLDYANFL